jgi:type II secretory pathway component PulF
MAWFEYEGHCPGGTAISGRIEAVDHAGARQQLDQMNVSLTELRPAGPPPRRRPLGREDFIYFNQQLASLAEAGLALDDGLRQMARDVQSPRLRRLLEEVAQDVSAGKSLDQAIEQRQEQFPLLYARVLRAGVATGNLPETLLNLNTHLQLMADTRRLIWEAVSYPLAVLILGILIFGGICSLVLPRFHTIFQDFDARLPVLTEWLFAMHDSYWPTVGVIALVVVGLAVAGRTLRFSERGRQIREAVLLRLPLVGRLYSASLLARFSQSAALCTASQMPLPDALRLAADATGSPTLGADADRLAGTIEQGGSPIGVTESTGLIPRLFGYSLQASSHTASLPDVLQQLADGYSRRADYVRGMVRSVAAPACIALLGVLLGTMIVALFLPLVSLVNSVSGGG